MAIHTEMLKINGPNGTLDGYLAAPEAGGAPGVVVIQEIFGVNEHIRSVTDRLAQAGYAALAPDLFWQTQPGFTSGYSPEEIEHARGLRGKIDDGKAVEDVGAALQVLETHPKCRGGKMGATGFCWGGLITYLVAARLKPACASSYYGGGIVNYIGEAQEITNPVMFHFGDQDASIPMDQVEQIKTTLQGRSDVEIFVYPGAGHGFHCEMRGSYDEASAHQAWDRTMEFFKKHLA